MFDVSFVELAIVALVALLVLGPERLPAAARTVGALLRKARQSWWSVKSEIERELAADELKRSVRAATAGADSLKRELKDSLDAAQQAATDTERAARGDDVPPPDPPR